MLALLIACAWTAGCARESDYVKRMRWHETRLQSDRVDYEVELQEARRQQDDNASHQHR
jgi:hypothetical protein